MKRYFLTGLAILLPVILTAAIVFFVINLLTNPFLGYISGILDNVDVFNKPFLFFTGEQILYFSSKVLILLLMVLVTFLVGCLGNWMVVHHVVRPGEYILHSIPFVNKIYKGAKDIVHTIFGMRDQRFTRVVLVPFPHSQTYSIGLVTNENVGEGSHTEYTNMVSVFVPGTPNPAMGFMLMYRNDQLKTLDMKVPDALKFVISCGVVTNHKVTIES